MQVREGATKAAASARRPSSRGGVGKSERDGGVLHGVAVDIDQEQVQVLLEDQGNCSILELNITLPER